MAKSKIPDAIERRHLIDRELSPAQALKMAEAYLAEGRDQDALEFLVKADATEQLADVRRRAIETGDLFLLRMVARAVRQEPTVAEWSALADAAEAAGKARYAAEARGAAELGDD